MARYQYDEEAMTFTPFRPGRIQVSKSWFVATLLLSIVGILAIVTVIVV